MPNWGLSREPLGDKPLAAASRRPKHQSVLGAGVMSLAGKPKSPSRIRRVIGAAAWLPAPASSTIVTTTYFGSDAGAYAANQENGCLGGVVWICALPVFP